MEFEDVINKRRTIRRYTQTPVPLEILKKLVDYARISPSGSNIQAIEYVIIVNPEMRQKIFPFLKWAGSLPVPERTPDPVQRPTAYIAVLLNTKIKKTCDSEIGAAVENILLGAVNVGLGACWMGAIDHKHIHALIGLPNEYELKYIISMGYPDENSMIEPFEDTYKYWKDEIGDIHVPKRSLDSIIFKIFD